MLYELWDAGQGNAIAGFSTEPEAPATVRAELKAGGRDAVPEWLLRRVDRRGRVASSSQKAPSLPLGLPPL
jgi:hypothetical protein